MPARPREKANLPFYVRWLPPNIYKSHEKNLVPIVVRDGRVELPRSVYKTPILIPIDQSRGMRRFILEPRPAEQFHGNRLNRLIYIPLERAEMRLPQTATGIMRAEHKPLALAANIMLNPGGREILTENLGSFF